ncbi:MAG: cytidine deaminase [Pseudomonadota bacterium]
MIENLISEAKSFVKSRFADTTWKGAAAILCKDGEILISTSPETVNESVSLCHETGGICEAYKKGKQVALSVCISFDDKEKCHILSPCGVCQERLWFWGGGVEVAVPQGSDSTKAMTITLDNLSPHYWRRPFMPPGGEI